jgi:dihydrofolate reductase
MQKVILDISMSVDGFITGPNSSHELPLGEGGERLHEWMGGNPPASFKQGGTTATMGAAVVGRRTYDQIDGWGGSHPAGIKPVCVVSKDVPEIVPPGNSTYTFVMNGIESTIAQAKAAAGDKNVYVVGGANIAQQCIEAGLLNEMHIHVAHVLLGGGVRLFGNFNRQIGLEKIEIDDAAGVTHLVFRPEK